jgi:hypothetical protein
MIFLLTLNNMGLNISFDQFSHNGICFEYIYLQTRETFNSALRPSPVGTEVKTKTEIMKKLFTLIAGSLLMLAASAQSADAFRSQSMSKDLYKGRPSVVVHSSKRFDIVVDGRSFVNDGNINLSMLRDGRHTIQVFELSRGIFQKRRHLVSTSNFTIRNKNLRIDVDLVGRIRITESKNRFDNDRGWDNDRGRDNDRNDRDRRY